MATVDLSVLSALLLAELTPHSLEDIVALANNPKTDEPYNIVHEWRYRIFGQFHYLRAERVAEWLKKPLEERIVGIAFALHEAAREEYD